MPDDFDVEAGRDEIARRLQQMHRLHLAQRPRQMSMRNMEGEGEMLSPLAVSVLGMGGTFQTSQQAARQDAHIASVAEMATTRISRRAQSYFNSFQTACTPATDDPPSYATAANQKPVSGREISVGKEVLPAYSCTVNAGVRMLVNMESVSPLHGVSQSEWRDVYVEIRGTMLNFHRVKDGRPNRLLRSYTLQHAEVGLAPDAFHTVLAPNSKLAHLIPSAARNKAYKKDPQLFRAEEQFIMRLRIETDQLLLAHSSEDKILEIMHDIGAGIDLAPPIDERSISKQCTVPRRRRRQQTPVANGDLTNATVVAEQERILQQMYPQFAQNGSESTTATTAEQTAQTQSTAPSTPTREDEELDLTAIREDFSEGNTLTPTTSSTSTDGSNPVRPTYTRTTTASSTTSTVYETAPSNFGPEGKWLPPHLRTAAQIRRYVRRCAPLLTSDSVRASDICICNGKRMRINWRAERLEDWRLQPPSYTAHDFAKEEQKKKQAAASVSFEADSAVITTATKTAPSINTPSSIFSETSSSASHDDIITPLEEQHNGLGGLDLVKTSTSGSIKIEKSTSPATTTPAPASQHKAREVQRETTGEADVHGVVFCF